MPGTGPVSEPLALGAVAVDQCLDGGLVCGGLHEVRAELARDIGAAAGFALGLAARAIQADRGGRQGVVWVSDPAARIDGGGLFSRRPCPVRLDPSSMTLVEPGDLQGAMWAAGRGGGAAPGWRRWSSRSKGNPGALRHYRDAAADAAGAGERRAGAGPQAERPRKEASARGDALAGENRTVTGRTTSINTASGQCGCP